MAWVLEDECRQRVKADVEHIKLDESVLISLKLIEVVEFHCKVRDLLSLDPQSKACVSKRKTPS